MLNERKFTDKQTSRDERAINSLLKQAQVSAHSGDGTSKFSQMARDRASLLRKTQKHLKKIKDSVEHDEEVINEDDFAEGMKDQFKMAGISGRLTRPMKDKVMRDLKSGDVRTARDSSGDIHPDDMSDIQALYKKGDKAGIARIIAARNKMDKPIEEASLGKRIKRAAQTVVGKLLPDAQYTDISGKPGPLTPLRQALQKASKTPAERHDAIQSDRVSRAQQSAADADRDRQRAADPTEPKGDDKFSTRERSRRERAMTAATDKSDAGSARAASKLDGLRFKSRAARARENESSKILDKHLNLQGRPRTGTSARPVGKSQGLGTSGYVSRDESFVNEEDSHVSADPRHPANQGGGTSRGGRMRNFPYIHTNPHTGTRVRHQLGNMTHTHPTTGEKVNTKGTLDTKTRGIPTKHEIRKAGETSEGYGQGPGYGKKGLKGFRKFLGKMDEAPSDENLKKYIDKAKKSEKSGRDAGFEGETPSEREAGVRQVRNRKRGVKNAEAILRRRASDRALDAENSDDAMDDRVVGR